MTIKLLLSIGIIASILASIAGITLNSSEELNENNLRIAYFPNIGHAIPIVGIENDREMLKISKKNIKINNFKKNIKVFAGDIEGKIEDYQFIERHSFDQIYANPPYFIEEQLFEPTNKNKRIANIGNKKTFDIWLKKALTFSKSGGTITFINHIQNLPEMLSLFSKKLGDIKITPILK